MKTFLKNKKGDGDTYIVSSKWWYYLISIFVISLCILLFVTKGFSFAQSQASTSLYLEEDILIAQLVNNCLVYEEEQGVLRGKIYQNTLDIRKFTQAHVDQCTYESLTLELIPLDEGFSPRSFTIGRPTNTQDFTRYVLVRVGDHVYPAHLKVIL